MRGRTMVCPLEADVASHADDEPTRRDFLVIAGNAFALVGGAAALWPFVAQMNPDAGAMAMATTEVDLAPVKEGQAITVLWRGKPVFIRNRTQEEIVTAEKTPLDQLPDISARNDKLPEDTPADDSNRIVQGKPNWLVLIGICTHLGCIPKGQSMGDERGEYGGWFCPCHGSHYDTSGRIRKGPAPRNLEVPPYEFVSDTKIKIG
jgi:ubiquinol-cytochrome c reductase iron-sulfur subunit